MSDPMTGGFRSPPGPLALALAVSLALHVAVLLNLAWKPHPAAELGWAITSRLVSPGPEAAGAAPVVAESPPPRPRAAPRKAAEPPAPGPLPALPAGPETPPDARVREILVPSPDLYELPERYKADGADFPYAWSSDMDTPPQTRTSGSIRYPALTFSSGLVLVRLLLATDGKVEKFERLCGRPPFDAVTMQELAAWSFAPATSHGAPARAWVLLEFAFLPDNAADGFDPSKADALLGSLREECKKQLSAGSR